MGFYNLSGPCGFVSQFDPGGGGGPLPGFPNWNAVAAFLAGEPLGTIAELEGTGSLPVCRAVSDGAGNALIIDGVKGLDWTRADSTKFTIGAAGSNNIQALGAVQPTLSGAGLDISLVENELNLNFWKLSGHLQASQAIVSCAIPNVVADQAIAIGSTVSGAVAALYGGVGYDGTKWYRRIWSGTAPPIRISVDDPLQEVLVPSGDQLVFLNMSRGNSNNTAITGGAWDATDPVLSRLQSQIATVAMAILDNTSRTLRLYCEGKSAAGFSAVVKNIRAFGGIV